jgi:hypothetical protein
MSMVAWNSFAVLELEQEWLRARKQVIAHSGRFIHTEQAMDSSDAGAITSYGANLGASVMKVLVEASTYEARAALATQAAVTAEGSSTVAIPMAARTLGVVGAAVSVGIAIHGWTSTKTSQTLVRDTVQELSRAIAGTQRWLASVGMLECAICGCSINLSHDAGCCQDSWHCFHEPCLRLWANKCAAGLDESAETAVERASSSCRPCDPYRSRDADGLLCPVCLAPLGSCRAVLEELLAQPIPLVKPTPSVARAPLENGTLLPASSLSRVPRKQAHSMTTT